MSGCLTLPLAGCHRPGRFVCKLSNVRHIERSSVSRCRTTDNHAVCLVRLASSPVRGGHYNVSRLGRCFSTSTCRTSQSPSIRYHAAAAFSAKRHPLDLDHNFHVHTSDGNSRFNDARRSAIRTESERPKSGQDAFFISDVSGSSALAFGVVDGVGGWEESGVNPANFAHSLCEYMAQRCSKFDANPLAIHQPIDPQDLLEYGFGQVLADERVVAGGSTACVGTATADGAVTFANLGDSGFAHFTPFQLNFVSPPQTHAFNTPYQLAKLPPRMLAQIKVFGGPKPHSETPMDSAITTHRLNHGDVLILATDGVWDNLFSEDLLRIVSKIMEGSQAWTQEKVPQQSVGDDLTTLVDSHRKGTSLSAMIAKAITREAKVASLDPKRMGPFAKEVQRAYPDENWHGGKEDDICAIAVVAARA